MTRTFAKLFQHEKYGQIVVLLDQDDEGDPAVKVLACPPNLGVCTTTFGFKQDERAQNSFDKFDIDLAAKAVGDMWAYGEELTQSPTAAPT